MAALNLPTQATYEVHEHVKVDTTDREDHHFCGIIFPVKCKNVLPIEHIIINSVAVRGELGPITVWVSNVIENDRPANGRYRFRLSQKHWTQVYEHTHEPSPRVYKSMVFSEPIILLPGQVRLMYIHSKAQGDQAIVYDNSSDPHPAPRHEDSMMAIFSGKAHLSPVPFGQTPIWGWGNSWRDHREFVGTLEYAARYKLWTPMVHDIQGTAFRKAVLAMLTCQRRCTSPVSLLPDECVYYIMNMCRWDWFGDTPGVLQARLREKRRREMQLQREQAAIITEQERMEQKQAENLEVETEQDVQKESSPKRQRGSESSAVDEEDTSDAVPDDEMETDSEADESEMEEDSESFSEDDGDFDDDASVFSSTSSDTDFEEAGGYRADTRFFTFLDAGSDDEDDAVDGTTVSESNERQAWFRRNLVRIHILRAMSAHNNDD